LERNLNLALQVLEITDRAVLCVNLVDEAQRHGISVDTRALSKDLGISVVPTAARQGRGIPDLLQAVHDVATGTFVCRPHRIKTGTVNLKRVIDRLTGKITSQFPRLPNARWVAFRILEGDQRVIEALENGELESIARGTEPQPPPERDHATEVPS
jgi:ferrous iron transport protein B